MSGPAMGGAPGRAAQMRPILVGWTWITPMTAKRAYVSPRKGSLFRGSSIGKMRSGGWLARG
jgi:hypothetical protein